MKKNCDTETNFGLVRKNQSETNFELVREIKLTELRFGPVKENKYVGGGE